MKLTTESKVFLGIFSVTAILLVFAMTFLTKPPKAKTLPKSTLVTSAAHVQGNPNASVYLVEFTDFECSACKAFAPFVEQLAKKYPDKLAIYYRYFPLPSHPFSKQAAYAAEAAGKQGKFFEAMNALYAAQETFSNEYFSTFAKTLGLNEETYAKDVGSQEIISVVAKDEETANLLNLPGTPTFFLNGTMLTLTSPQDLLSAVEKALVQ